MIILRAYKTELDLNNKQRTLCAKHAGTARFAYNWGLARKIEAFKAGQKTPTAIDLHRELNALKKTDFKWMYEVSKCAPQESLRNLDKAFLNFFRRVSLKEEVEIEKAQGSPVGVDLGIKTMAVCSDSRFFENPKALRNTLRKLRRAQRALGRRQKGSKNREKSKRKVAKLHYRIANIRKNAIHKATSSIVAKTKPVEQKPSVVVIEDLSVENMLKNHKLARAISDVGFFEFRRQLTYKTALLGVSLLLADRFFPSSKLCSVCGAINNNLTLDDRTWTCDCGAHHERDLNAAINLSRLALNYSI